MLEQSRLYVDKVNGVVNDTVNDVSRDNVLLYDILLGVQDLTTDADQRLRKLETEHRSESEWQSTQDQIAYPRRQLQQQHEQEEVLQLTPPQQMEIDLNDCNSEREIVSGTNCRQHKRQ